MSLLKPGIVKQHNNSSYSLVCSWHTATIVLSIAGLVMFILACCGLCVCKRRQYASSDGKYKKTMWVFFCYCIFKEAIELCYKFLVGPYGAINMISLLQYIVQ